MGHNDGLEQLIDAVEKIDGVKTAKFYIYILVQQHTIW